MDKPTSFAHKEMSTFCFSDDQDWRKFSVLRVQSFYATLMKYFHIVIMAIGLYCDFESFPDASKVIQVFQVQIQSNNYIANYNANTKTDSCLNPIFCHCY